MDSKMKTAGVAVLIVVALALVWVSLKSTLLAAGPAKATPEQGKAMAEAMKRSAAEREKAGPVGAPHPLSGGSSGAPVPR